MVGSSILRHFKKKGYKNLFFKKRSSLNLLDQRKTYNYLKKIKPDFVIIAAAKVGGIYANQNFKAEFIYNNIMIQTNLIHASYKTGVKKLIFLGSSCIYPKYCKQPIKEEYLLSGKLEETNDAYAVAKIAGIKMCQSFNEQYKLNYKCLMPTNTFGPNDNYDSNNSHFITSLIKKTHDLKISNKNEIEVWGNGKSKREVIHVDDLADACVYFMKKKTNHSLINIGTGKDYSINYYVNLITKLILNRKIKIKYDKSKPNGVFRKVMDVSLAKKYGWTPKIKLNHAIMETYKSLKKEKIN